MQETEETVYCSSFSNLYDFWRMSKRVLNTLWRKTLKSIPKRKNIAFGKITKGDNNFLFLFFSPSLSLSLSLFLTFAFLTCFLPSMNVQIHYFVIDPQRSFTPSPSPSLPYIHPKLGFTGNASPTSSFSCPFIFIFFVRNLNFPVWFPSLAPLGGKEGENIASQQIHPSRR